MPQTPESIFPHTSLTRRGHETHASEARFLLDPIAFRHVLDHERARSDRSEKPFAVVTFQDREEKSRRPLRTIIERLARHLRTIDEVGWIDGSRLAAVLPYSNAEAAWKVVDDVVAELPISSAPPNCEVFVYPSNWPGPEFDNDPGRRTQQLEPLFARKLPWWKRLMDIAGSILGLVLLAPLFLFVAIGIKLSSPGPIFFSQWRTGLGGRRFRMHKFRTMVTDAEQRRNELLQQNEQDGPAFKITNDPRVTRFGRLLRITSIDEFPQLWNVLKGEMSIVGPRPLPCFEAEDCEVWQRRRFDVTPGLTCVWQTQGRPRTSFSLWMRLDLQYIRDQSFWTDVKLILLTIPTILRNRADR